MAVAAFKSTSRRPTTTTTTTATSRTNLSASSDKETTSSKKPTSPNQQKPQFLRRSRSVSAVSRSLLQNITTASSSSSSSSDFLLTTRENPLYWTNNVSSPPDHEDEKGDNDMGNNGFLVSKHAEVTRGRSAARSSDVVKSVDRKVIGRSLPRVDTGRRNRSVSRGPGSRGQPQLVNSESEAEQEGSFLTNYKSRNSSNSVSNVGRKSNVAERSSNRLDARIQSNGSAAKPSSSPIRGEGVLGRSSYSEAEERTIKAVCEQMKSFEGDNLGSDTPYHIYETVRSEVRRAIADIQIDLETAIRRSNAAAIATTNVTDMPPDLVNPSAVELVLDIRREYADKLEQSHERARKLRGDLAVEEHRGLELSRILKEVLPDPKTSNVQKSRPGRKSSIERRRMSKRLTDEAMAYFDECVSLSTFDSSDFSSQEDPPNIRDINTPASGHPYCLQTSCKKAANHCSSSTIKQEPGSTCNHYAPGPASSGSNDPSPDEVGLNQMDTEWDGRFRFSFSHRPNDTFELQQDIKKYVKDIDKVHLNSQTLKSKRYDLDECSLRDSPQSLLFDRLFFKSRIESGSMLLCGGSGTAISLSPFSSVI